jgi:hypothetical protein
MFFALPISQSPAAGGANFALLFFALILKLGLSGNVFSVS